METNNIACPVDSIIHLLNTWSLVIYRSDGSWGGGGG